MASLLTTIRSGAAFRACLPPSPMLTLATNHLELLAPVLLRIPPKPRALCPHREHQTRSSLIQPIRLELRRSNVLALYEETFSMGRDSSIWTSACTSPSSSQKS